MNGYQVEDLHKRIRLEILIIRIKFEFGDEKMPLVRIEMKKGKSSEYKKTLFDCVHSG